jgi:CDP-diacylglycerol--glycerol-3-phosphate 3-phosphatidyltransferase
MFDGSFRVGVDRAVKPVGASLRRMGVSADALTATGLVIAALAAVAIGFGKLQLGLILVVLAALPDLLDGAVAKAAGSSGPRGAFFDSVADRVTDALLFGGVAWYLQSARGGHAAILPLAVLGVSSIISYERAKAELLGFDAKGGLMERAERIILLCGGLLFASSTVLLGVLWVMLALTAITAVQRFVKVWRQASQARPAPTWRTTRRARRVARTSLSERQRMGRTTGDRFRRREP